MNITKVVIPAAGRGTRFLPLTKTIPKEMLPLLEKPAFQYIIEEGLFSEIKNYCIINSKGKGALEDYFDEHAELTSFLKEHNKEHILQTLNKIRRLSTFSYIRQAEQLGLGHAVSLASPMIQPKEFFGVMLPDDIITDTKIPALEQLIRIAQQEKASVIAVQEVAPELVNAYGIIEIKKQISNSLFQVSHIAEKPHQKDAPSNLAVVGRYVLSQKIFSSLDYVKTYGIDGEIQLTDAITHMIQNNEKVFAYKIQGTRYDIGTPVGWIKAIIGMSLQHPVYGPAIKHFLADSEVSTSFIAHSKNISLTL